MQWEFVLTYVLLNMNLVEKIKIITLFNRMSVQQKLGKLVNLIMKLFLLQFQRKGDPIIISKDEEFSNVKIAEPTLNAVLQRWYTAANASTINDGAAALILMRGKSNLLG
jgi:acetyl-CoA C-acetyltransferase